MGQSRHCGQVPKKTENKVDRATALWALSNLAWSDRENQTRCGNFIHHILILISEFKGGILGYNGPITDGFAKKPRRLPEIGASVASQSVFQRQGNSVSLLECTHATKLVANIIHFHDQNRNQLCLVPGGVEVLISLSKADQICALREPALRCLACLTASISGTNRVALANCSEDVCGILLRAASDKHAGGEYTNIRQLGAVVLSNIRSMATSHAALHQNGELDALVSLSGTTTHTTSCAALPNRIESSISSSKLREPHIVSILRSAVNPSRHQRQEHACM